MTQKGGAAHSSANVNICCMCFRNYDDDDVLESFGAKWIDSACRRWLHLDCTEDCIVDRFGKERYCLYCMDCLC